MDGHSFESLVLSLIFLLWMEGSALLLFAWRLEVSG